MSFITAMSSFVSGNAAGGAGNPLSTMFGVAGNAIAPIQRPEKSELMDMYVRGFITHDVFRQHMRAYGYTVDDVAIRSYNVSQFQGNTMVLRPLDVSFNMNLNNHLVKSRQWFPTVDEVLRWQMRGLITNGMANVFLKANGVLDPNVRAMLPLTQQEIPGPSDLIRFVTRDAFEPDVIEEYDYHKEFPRRVLPFMLQQGYGGSTGMDRPPGATDSDNQPMDGKATWTDLYWYAHWELPSLTQAYECLHRLYPSSSYGMSPILQDFVNAHPRRNELGANELLALVDKEIAFDINGINKLQKNQDIPQYWRTRLQAISYLPLTRVDVRRMFDLGVLQDAGVYHAYRAIGYDDRNAKLLLDFTKANSVRTRVKKDTQVALAKVKEGYDTGIVSEEQARVYLERLGFNQDERNAIIVKWNLDFSVANAKRQLLWVKKAYMGGWITPDETRRILMEMGINERRISDYTTLWNFQFRYDKREVKAKELLDWFEARIVNEEMLTQRLQNMGFDSADVSRMIVMKKGVINERIGKLQQIGQKEAIAIATKNAKEREKISKARIKELEASNKRLVSVYDEKHTKQFYDEKLIDLDEVRDRLKLRYGWHDEDITNWISANLKPKEGEESGGR